MKGPLFYYLGTLGAAQPMHRTDGDTLYAPPNSPHTRRPDPDCLAACTMLTGRHLTHGGHLEADSSPDPWQTRPGHQKCTSTVLTAEIFNVHRNADLRSRSMALCGTLPTIC